MKTRLFKSLLALTTLLLILLVPASVHAATVITVTTTADVIAADGLCSLREAVIAANTDTATSDCPSGSGADTIVFSPILPSPSIFILGKTGANEDNAATGDLDLFGMITIQGAGAAQTILDGNGTDRVFDVRPGAFVTISGPTIRNGNPGAGAGGGGILVSGSAPTSKLTLTNAFVLNNSAVNGGGIQVLGNGATAALQNTRISSNVATVGGGGLSNNGILTLLNSVLDENQARTGGGIDHSGFSMNLTNVTVSGNSAGDNGGGIYNRADAILLNVTLAGNAASGSGTGGAIYNDEGFLAIKNSIVADSDADGNCFNSGGQINSQGHNLDGGDTCKFTASGDMSSTDPLLDTLQDNGGGTFTQALLSGSPAIDSADNNGCPKTDQRGFVRPMDGNSDGSAVCDIGAFELDAAPGTSTATATSTIAPPPSDTPTPTSTTVSGSTDTPTPTLTTTSTPPSTETPVPPMPPCSSAALILVALGLLIRLRPVIKDGGA
jgi:CSLREA domain-containing protein